jgi:Rrf2 family protein
MSNTHFAIAIHALTLLAMEQGRPLPATQIAASVNTHPVFLRRVLAPLQAAGIVESSRGISGGVRLLRSPDKISLREVFDAVGKGAHLLETHPDPHPDCPVGGHIEGVLTPLFAGAEAALQAYFGSVTVAEVLAEIKKSH